MNESNYTMFAAVRLMVALLPLALGWPVLAFCFCAHNLVVITASRGPVYGGVCIAGASLAGALLCLGCGYSAAYGGFFALQTALASALCSVTVLTRRSFTAGLMAASVSYGLGDVMNLRYMANEAGLSIADYMFSGVRDIVQQTSASYKEQVAAVGVNMDADALTELIGNGIKSCVPAAIILGALAAGYILMWMVSRTLRGTPLDNGHSFANIRLNIPAVCFGAAMLALVFVPYNLARLVGLNGMLIFFFLAFASGLSLTEFLLRQKIANPFFRLGIHALIFLGSALLSAVIFFANIFLIYALMGIVDCFASFRKRVNSPS